MKAQSDGRRRQPVSALRKPTTPSRPRVLTGQDLVHAHRAPALTSKLVSAGPSIAVGRGHQPRAKSGPAASPCAGAATWLAVPAELLRDIRADGFSVEQLTSHYAVRVSREQPYNLIRLRVTVHGSWAAQAAGNSGFGRMDAFKAEAPLVERRIRDALQRTSRTGVTTYVRAAMGQGRGRLVKSARKFAPPTNRRSRTQRYWEVQGGAPGLGKRA